MAVYCEQEEMVQHIRFKTQSFYEALKRDAIAEQLYTPEGDIEVYFSRSLEKEPPVFAVAPVNNTGKSAPPSSNNNESPSKNNKKAMKIVNFEICSDAAHMYLFAKDLVPKPPTAPFTSSLSKSIQPAITELKDPLMEYPDCTTTQGGIVLTIYTWIPGQAPISPRITEKASVGQAIAAVLRLYTAQKREPAAVLDPKLYVLRIADSDTGKPDEDCPALDEKQLINKFKDETFVMIKTKSAAPEKQAKEAIVFKVNFPDQSYTNINVKPDMKIGELTSIVAKRRQYNEQDHFLRLSYAETPCDVNMTVEQLDVQELTLSNKSMLRPPQPEEKEESNGVMRRIEEIKMFRKSTNAPPPQAILQEETPKELFWYDALAFAFKSYEVLKIKKYGKKLETTLNVDRDRIAHLSRDSTKSKSHMIRDVTRVALLEKPRQFLIEYVGEVESHSYEAKSLAEASEIVGKIQYLVKAEPNIKP